VGIGRELVGIGRELVGIGRDLVRLWPSGTCGTKVWASRGSAATTWVSSAMHTSRLLRIRSFTCFEIIVDIEVLHGGSSWGFEATPNARHATPEVRGASLGEQVSLRGEADPAMDENRSCLGG